MARRQSPGNVSRPFSLEPSAFSQPDLSHVYDYVIHVILPTPHDCCLTWIHGVVSEQGIPIPIPIGVGSCQIQEGRQKSNPKGYLTTRHFVWWGFFILPATNYFIMSYIFILNCFFLIFFAEKKFFLRDKNTLFGCKVKIYVVD